jgi:hypothetical protein
MSLFTPYTFTGQQATPRYDPLASFLTFASPGCVFTNLGMKNSWDDVSALIRGTGVPIVSNTATGQRFSTATSGSASNFFNTGTYRQSTAVNSVGGATPSWFFNSNNAGVKLPTSGDFTIEFWINQSSNTNPRWLYADYDYGSIPNTAIYWFPAATATQSVCYLSGGGSETLLFTNLVSRPATGAWGHMAMTRQGNVWRVFLNGALCTTVTLNKTMNSTATAVNLNGHPTTANTSGITIQDWRIYKGVAKYTAAFTAPPAMIIAP